MHEQETTASQKDKNEDWKKADIAKNALQLSLM